MVLLCCWSLKGTTSSLEITENEVNRDLTDLSTRPANLTQFRLSSLPSAKQQTCFGEETFTWIHFQAAVWAEEDSYKAERAVYPGESCCSALILHLKQQTTFNAMWQINSKACLHIEGREKHFIWIILYCFHPFSHPNPRCLFQLFF